MPDLEIVKTVAFEVKVFIRQYGDQFDWSASNGDESSELFDSIEDAEYDANSRY